MDVNKSRRSAESRPPLTRRGAGIDSSLPRTVWFPVWSNSAPQEITGNLFEGPILPVTIKLGFPILLSNLLNFFYNIVDTVFISMIDRAPRR